MCRISLATNACRVGFRLAMVHVAGYTVLLLSVVMLPKLSAAQWELNPELIRMKYSIPLLPVQVGTLH